MSHKAQALADYYSRSGNHTAHAGLYTDGAIVYLAVTEDTQNELLSRDDTDQWQIESARSADGFCGVLIVRGEYMPDLRDGDDLPAYLRTIATGVFVDNFLDYISHEMGGDLKVTDNRDKDHHLIDDFVDLVNRLHEPGE